MVSRLRWLTAGESHGPALTAIIEGLPASFHITTADLDRDLARRRLGTGRGARMKFETKSLLSRSLDVGPFFARQVFHPARVARRFYRRVRT